MKKHILIRLVVAAVVSATWSVSFGDAPRIGSTVGSSTVPPSRYQPSLRARPDNRARYQLRNELITGNVGGGRHFRDEASYSGRYEFDGPMSSDEINSFIRRSSSPYYRRDSMNYSPYYLPSRTVSSLRRLNESGLSVPPVTFPGGTGRYKMVAPVPKEYDANPHRRRRPLEQNINIIQLKMLREAQKEDPYLVDLKNQVRDDVIRDILLRDRIQEEDARADARAKAEAKVKEMLESEDVSSREKPIGALEKEKAAEPGRPARIGPEQETVSSLERIRIAEQSRLIDSEEVDDSQKGLGEQEPSEDDEEEAVEDEKGASPFSKIDHQTAMDIISPYKTYREYARAKFSRYMRIGDANMKDGRFYKAADAFTLAAIYTSEDPMPYGSRGIALFAAGEYLASMDYLQRAFDLSDVYAAKKIDLVSLIGRETFDKRLSELITCCKASDISQFHLLASYIQYQTGDLGSAGASLDSAAVRMIENASVDAMRKAIESGQQGIK